MWKEYLMVRNRISTFFLRVTEMRNSDVVKEIESMTNNRKETNMNIDQLIEDVVTQLDKDPMDQMVDTETIIREFVNKLMQAKQ